MSSILKSLDEAKLLSLKTFEYTGQAPAIQKEIPGLNKLPAGVGNIFQNIYNEADLQISRRADDVIRITKLLASPAGIKFAAKQQLINTTVNFNKSLGKNAGLEQTAKTLATILAQTAVSGTSIHLRSITDEYTYLRREKATNDIQVNLPSNVESTFEERKLREINPAGIDRVQSVVYRQDLELEDSLRFISNDSYIFKFGNRVKIAHRANSPTAIDRKPDEILYYLDPISDEITRKESNFIQKNLPVKVGTSLQERVLREINPVGEDRAVSKVYFRNLEIEEDLRYILNNKYANKFGNRYKQRYEAISPDKIHRRPDEIDYYLAPNPVNLGIGMSKIEENLPSVNIYSPKDKSRAAKRPVLVSKHFIEKDPNLQGPSFVEEAKNGYEYIYEEPNSPSLLSPIKPYVPGKTHSKPYRGANITPKEVHVRLNMSKNNLPTLKLADTIEGVDRVNHIGPVSVPDEIGENGNLIPFKFVLYRANNAPTFLYFRAHLESLSDTFGGTWSPVQYIGRGETFHNFSVFSRSISFNFQIAAYSEAELLPLYQKLNFLAGSTAATYTDATGYATSSPFMKGNFVRVTIGEYFDRIPGFFNNISVTWDQNSPWEIKQDYYDENEVKQTYVHTPIVPHLLSINCSFLPIHDFAPEAGKPFIGTVSDNIMNKPIYTPGPLRPKLTFDEPVLQDIPDISIDFENEKFLDLVNRSIPSRVPTNESFA